MALSAAIIITGIAIGLLVVYGADVCSRIQFQKAERASFRLTTKTRGMGLGLPALVLPFVAFFISRKEPSKGLGGMIIAAGILILVGGIVVIGKRGPCRGQRVRQGRDVRDTSAVGCRNSPGGPWGRKNRKIIGTTCLPVPNARQMQKRHMIVSTLIFEEFCVECYTELHYYLNRRRMTC